MGYGGYKQKKIFQQTKIKTKNKYPRKEKPKNVLTTEKPRKFP